MQNRNFIKIVAVVFALICLYQLSFTWVADGVEKDAVEYSESFNENLNWFDFFAKNTFFPFLPKKSTKCGFGG